MLSLVLLCLLPAMGWGNMAGPTLDRGQIKNLLKQDLIAGTKLTILNNLNAISFLEFQEIMGEVVEEELTNDNAKSVLQFISNQPNGTLYHGYVKVFETINKKSLNDGVLFELAYKIKTDLLRGYVVPLLNLLPPSLKELITFPTVCIKNRGYSEYFYAAANDLKYDSTKRHVFTWRPLSGGAKAGDWRFKHIEGNKFHIINPMFGEYLYAENNSHNHDSERRRIFTSVRSDRAAEWAVELDKGGRDVFIRNVHYDEYIYSVDGAYYDKDRRRVFSWVPKGRASCDGATYQCRWLLDSC